MTSGKLSLGALVAALGVAASWLCCLPLAVGIVGAGAAGLGAFLTPLRPYLNGLTLAFLGLAFFQVYGPQSRPGADCECRKRLFRRRLIVWATAVIALLLMTFSSWASWLIYWTL